MWPRHLEFIKLPRPPLQTVYGDGAHWPSSKSHSHVKLYFYTYLQIFAPMKQMNHAIIRLFFSFHGVCMRMWVRIRAKLAADKINNVQSNSPLVLFSKCSIVSTFPTQNVVGMGLFATCLQHLYSQSVYYCQITSLVNSPPNKYIK